MKSRPFRSVLLDWARRTAATKVALDIRPQWRSTVPAAAENVTWFRPKTTTTAYALYTYDGSVWASKFSTMAKKNKGRVWWYKFKTEKQREQYITSDVKKDMEAAASRLQQREERKSMTHDFKVGDILEASWGYEQTNIDYAMVIEVLDKKVKIVPIGKKFLGASGTSDKVVPDPQEVTGPAMIRLPRGKYIRGKDDFIQFRKWDGGTQHQTNSVYGH